jgi:hypothetical protein
MIAYLVHNKKEKTDTIVLPEIGCSMPADEAGLKNFISVNPNFKELSGDACGQRKPEDYGTIVATRDECGDVNVVKKALWQERLNHHLGSGRY